VRRSKSHRTCLTTIFSPLCKSFAVLHQICIAFYVLHVSYRKLCGFHISKFFTPNTAANSNTQPYNCHSCHPVCLQFTGSIFPQQAEREVRSSHPGHKRLEDVGKVRRRNGGRKEQVLSLGREQHVHYYKPVTETVRRNY
jgi:hypothetical protein